MALERKTYKLWPEAGKALGLGKNAIYEAATRGEIPGAFRVGRKWFVAKQAFDRVMAQGSLEDPANGHADTHPRSV